MYINIRMGSVSIIKWCTLLLCVVYIKGHLFRKSNGIRLSLSGKSMQFMQHQVGHTRDAAGAGTEIGEISCAYCRQMGWAECITRYCTSRNIQIISPPIPQSYPAAKGTFGVFGNIMSAGQARHLELRAPPTEVPRIQFNGPTPRPGQSVQSTAGRQSLDDAVLAAMYCEICRALGWKMCMNNHCFVSAPTSPLNGIKRTGYNGLSKSGKIATKNTGIQHGKMTSTSSNIVRNYAPSNNRGAFGTMLASIYCEYCAMKNWTQCIDQYCFMGLIALSGLPPSNFAPTSGIGVSRKKATIFKEGGFRRDKLTSGPSMRVPSIPRSKYKKHLVSSNPVTSPTAGKQWISRAIDPKLAPVFCNFCQVLNWTECIGHFCVPFNHVTSMSQNNMAATLTSGLSGTNVIHASGAGFRHGIKVSRSSGGFGKRPIMNFQRSRFQSRKY